MSALVAPFSQLGLADLARVGGKGANLGELTRAGFPVPPGFCVTTDGYRAFLAACPADVLGALDGLDADVARVRVAGARVREGLLAVPMPAEVADAARAAWEALGADHPVAVRSSATAEDLPDASFAGQQDTYLNLRGADAVLDGIRRCWVSLFTDRAILYRIQHGFPHADVSLSVVVQRQILPEVAGILFTADPITSNRSIVSIDAGFGLGEGLVSGRVSADQFHVDRRTGRLVHKRIADKALAIRPRPDGGTVEEALADPTAPSLSDAQAEALAALGVRIEAHYGQPQDVEWCVASGEVFVVQSRPITTLYPVPSPAPPPDSVARGLHVYVSWNHVQAMTDPMPPMARSLIVLANPLGKGGRATIDTKYMASAGGRLYHDATELLRIPLVARYAPKLVENSDPLMGRALADVVARPGFVAGGRWTDTVALAWAGIVRAAPVLARMVGHLVLGRPEDKVPAVAAALDRTLAGWEARIAAAPAGAARLRVVRAMVWQILPDIDATLSLIFASAAANDALRALTGDKDRVAAMLRATPHNVLTEKDERLAAIAELARGDGAAAAWLRDPPPGAATLAGLDGPVRAALAAWFDRFGDRAPGEVDVSRPRYREDPRPIWRALAALLDGPPGAFAAQQARYAAEAAAASAAFAAKGVVYGRLARVGRHLFAAREQPKFYWLRVIGVARRALQDEGARLAASGALADAAHVWALTLDELVQLADGDASVAALVPARLAAHRRDEGLEAARVLTSDGEVVVARHAGGDAPEGAWVGVSASPGVAEGVARVIHDPATETLQPGEILVAAYTDPGWTPLFPLAAGLVMEVGGQMTHGSVVAREYGIPAVVCVPGATRVIRDGQRIRVDGDRGWVVAVADSVGV